MAVAARINPKDFFAPDDWRRLQARSSWKGLALVAHCWAVIGLTTAASLLWPWLLPLAIPIIGARQLGLGILQHDAAHGALHPNAKINDWVGEWLCGGGVQTYRKYHLQHHKFAQQAEDPDLVLSAPFPIRRASFRRKLVRDLTGQTWFKQRFGRLQARLKAREAGAALWPILFEEIVRQRRWLIFNGLAILAFGAAGYWWGWFALWLAPRATWFQLVTRMRNIAEHALVAKDEPDPLRHARTTHANLIERALIAPYYVNYHCEHHMVMHVPCWNLPRANRLLGRDGVLPRMQTAPGYGDVLRAVTAAPAGQAPFARAEREPTPVG
ncbi:MAG TPA: fatty acid desaturase family protein [Caulobacteraceae bacterium]|jgi:fatty acid desaturase|nr:fatty acid desaturase family protein [Caulobacteraceae bacterium]